jgi:hypothetical protein
MMKRTIAGICLVLACAMAWALPTVQQVQAEVQEGHYAQAERMMREVVDAKPGSAKGHYLYAEILAHNGSVAKAAEEAGRARQIDPDIKFTQPEKFRAFEALLERERKPAQRAETPRPVLPAAAMAAPMSQQAAGLPGWVWGGALALVAYLLWRGFSRRRALPAQSAAAGFASAAPTPAFGTPGMGGAAPSHAGVPPASPANGLLGTGLAVAGGVAAGMLVDEVLHRRTASGTDQISGLQHDIFNVPPTDPVADELENRSIDFGNGADWDSGGGNADVSGSDDGGGWD